MVPALSACRWEAGGLFYCRDRRASLCVEGEGHKRELLEVRDEKNAPVTLDQRTAEILAARLKSLEAKRLCGTAGLCPSELVEALAEESL